jgi:HEAT repeat protein
MAAATRPTVPALIEALSDENAAVRREAISALGLIGDKRAIPPLITLLRQQEVELSPSAAISLSRIGSPAVPELTALLQNEPEPVRYLAVEALGLIGRAALPSLFAAIQDESHYVRNQAAIALGLIGEENPELVIRITPYLIDLLADDNDFVRHNACQLLTEVHEPELIDQLADRLTGDSLVTRYRAVIVLTQLSRIGHPDLASALSERAVPALINTLQDSNSAVRRESAAALGQIGSQSQEVGARVAPVLQGKLTDIDLRTHWTAASALGRIGTPALPSLSEALQDKNRDVRHRVVWALGTIGEPAAPALISALDDLDPRVRERAVTALGQIASEDSAPALIDRLQDTEDEVQNRAAWALARIDTKEAQEAVKVWREAQVQEHLG